MYLYLQLLMVCLSVCLCQHIWKGTLRRWKADWFTWRLCAVSVTNRHLNNRTSTTLKPIEKRRGMTCCSVNVHFILCICFLLLKCNGKMRPKQVSQYKNKYISKCKLSLIQLIVEFFQIMNQCNDDRIIMLLIAMAKLYIYK